MLFSLPLCHTEVASIPLTFTERVRDYTSLPLPLFLRRSRLLFPFSEGLRNIPPSFVPFWTVVKPVLFCAFLHLAGLTLTYIRPANMEQPLLRPTSFQEDLSGHISVLLGRPSLLSPPPPSLTFAFLRKRAGAGSIHAPSFSSSPFVLCCHFFQHIPHVDSCLIIKDQCVQMRPFYAQIAGLTHHCPCRPSHLLPHRNFLNFASSTLLFVRGAIVQSKLLLPSTEWPWWKVSRPHASINKDKEVVHFWPRCSCHLSPQF